MIKIRILYISTILLVFSLSKLGFAQVDEKDFGLSMESLFYGNENEVLTRLFWLTEEEIIGIRYSGDIPKDLVLLNHQRLIKDSLSINQLFLDGYHFNSKRFISIHGIIQTGDHEGVIVHNFGSTHFQIADEKIKMITKVLPEKRPKIDDEYFDGYELVQLDGYTLGFKGDRKKWVKDADYWIYNWDSGEFSIYEDSKHPVMSKNDFWDKKNDPETFSTYSYFFYNIIQTKDGFLFNLPLKNRFVIYDSMNNKMQGYNFPELKNKKQSWFAFYDRILGRYFAVLDAGTEYLIHSLNVAENSFYALGKLGHKPLGVAGGKAYIREITYKENKKGYYFDHHLLDLYPRLK